MSNCAISSRSLSQNQKDALEVYQTKLELELKGRLKELVVELRQKRQDLAVYVKNLGETLVKDAHTTIPESFTAAVANLNTLGLDLIIYLDPKDPLEYFVQRTKGKADVYEFALSAIPSGKHLAPKKRFDYIDQEDADEDDDRNPSEVEDEIWEDSYWDDMSEGNLVVPSFTIKFRKPSVSNGSKGLAAISIPHFYKIPEPLQVQLQRLLTLEAEFNALQQAHSDTNRQLRTLPEQKRVLLAALAEENLLSTKEGRELLAQISGTPAVKLLSS